MKGFIFAFVLILVGCGGSANVGRDGDAIGGAGVDVKVDVHKYDGFTPAVPVAMPPPPVATVPTFAQYCSTPVGDCPMMVAMPINQSCQCNWGFGRVSWGISR